MYAVERPIKSGGGALIGCDSLGLKYAERVSDALRLADLASAKEFLKYVKSQRMRVYPGQENSLRVVELG